MATIDDTVGKLARVYDSQTDTWIPLVGSPVPHVHNVSSSPDVDITEPLIDNEILAYSTSASAFVNTDSPTFDVATIDTANIDVANIIQPSTTVKPLIIRSTAPQTAAVTAATASSGSVTYAITSAETIFTAGDLVTISGINPSTLDDVRATVGSVSSGSVVIFSGKTGTYVSGGTATRIHANLLEIQNSAGTPTSTIRSDGSVTGELTGGLVHINTTTMSAVASQSLTGVFSSTYDNYKLVFRFTATGADTLNLRLRLGASDDSTANYQRQKLEASGTTVSGSRTTNQTSGLFSDISSAAPLQLNILEVSGPFSTLPTMFFSSNSHRSTTTHFLSMHTLSHNVNTSFDGISILPNTGTITGTVSVYGYAKA
jgi:hypothetical protein